MHGRASKAAVASEVRNDLRAALTTIEASKNITAAAQEARRKAEARGRDPRGNPLSALAEALRFTAFARRGQTTRLRRKRTALHLCDNETAA